MYTGLTELLSHFNFMVHDSITLLYAPCLQILTLLAFEITIVENYIMYHDSVSAPHIARLQASLRLVNKLHPILEILDLDQSFV
jgi:hypothetical protein